MTIVFLLGYRHTNFNMMRSRYLNASSGLDLYFVTWLMGVAELAQL